MVLETDLQDVVDLLLNRNHTHLSVHAPIAMDILKLMIRDWTVRINHIFREANTVADSLAKMGLNSCIGYKS